MTVADEMYEDVPSADAVVAKPARTPDSQGRRAPVDWSDVPEPDPEADGSYVRLEQFEQEQRDGTTGFSNIYFTQAIANPA